MAASNERSADESPPKTARRVSMWRSLAYWLPAVGIAIGVFILSSTRGTRFPVVPLWGADKLVHALMYGSLAVALAFPLSTRRLTSQPRWLVLTTVFCCSVYGVLDECNQSFIPFRTPSAADVLADGIGALCGSLFVVFWQRRRAKRPTGC